LHLDAQPRRSQPVSPSLDGAIERRGRAPRPPAVCRGVCVHTVPLRSLLDCPVSLGADSRKREGQRVLGRDSERPALLLAIGLSTRFCKASRSDRYPWLCSNNPRVGNAGLAPKDSWPGRDLADGRRHDLSPGGLGHTFVSHLDYGILGGTNRRLVLGGGER